MRFSNRAMRTAALGLAAGLALALPAAAIPVDVYADGTADFGFDPNDVSAAINAGADAPTEVDGLSGAIPWLTITTPSSLTEVTQGKSRENPSKGSSTWTLDIASNAPVGALDDLALVIVGHDANDPKNYKSENVGLTIDTELPWLFVTPEGVSATGTGGASGPVYVAFLLGDLEAGGSYQVPIEYLLAQKLKKDGKNELGEKLFKFPLYAYAVVSVSGVPEPSTLALLALGALATCGAARRAR